MANVKDGEAHGFSLGRRNLLQAASAAMAIPAVARITTAFAQERLAGSGDVVVFSYGGSFTEGVRRNVYAPYTKATGIKVVDVVADYAEPQARAMFQAGRIDWDVAYVQSENYPTMRDAGMFAPIDYTLWDQEALQGTPAQTRRSDAAVVLGAAMVLAYNQRAFPNGGPQTWADFWDVKKFPGPRGLYAPQATYNIQFALLADGVAPKDIWPLTDNKLDRAFRKLEEIKPHITKWWSAGGEAPQLLINGEYAMTSAWDNRLLVALRQGAPIKTTWEGGTLGYSWAVILKGGPNTVNAQKFLAFLYRAQTAAGWTQGTGSPGPNINQLKYLPAEVIPNVNVNPDNASKLVVRDIAWLSLTRPSGKTNLEHIQERWLKWRSS
jgi:putative spermidine/putrescine transport system substrate-binding protein/mannopine transport system substrate-binding protein